MHRPLLSEFVWQRLQERDADFERRIAMLEEKVARLESAIAVTQNREVTISGSRLNVDTPTTHTTGVVNCNTLVAQTVNAQTYTPGAGNIW